MIQQTDKRIMDALSCALRGGTVDWARTLDAEAWAQLYRCAVKHSVLPLVVDALPLQRSGIKPDPSGFAGRAQKEILLQACKTGEMCLLYRYLRGKGLHPLVMKGIVCRSLYPAPEHRSSVDEDLLIKPAEFQRMHEALLAYGLQQVKPELDASEQFEVSYRDSERGLYIEVHKTPFPPESPYLDRLNDCFLGAHDRAIPACICGTDFLTLGLEDHLLYLLLHALKHFLFSGFGIRQICDVAVFSEYYRNQIDWSRMKARLKKIDALVFARAVYRIATDYLLKDSPLTQALADWNLAEIDAEPLLADVMDGGLYGSATMSRLHSSNMTLRAASNQSGHGLSAVLYSLFPPMESMQVKYPYLKKLPLLLPLAWFQRHVSYLWELLRHRGRSNSALTSIRVGSERIRLLEQYRVISK